MHVIRYRFKIQKRQRRATAAAAVAAVTASLALVPSASADSVVWFEGILNGVTVHTQRNSLTETSVRSLDGGYSCTGAYNLDGSIAGSLFCTYTVTAHPYCGCQLRFPAAAGGPANLRARRDY